MDYILRDNEPFYLLRYEDNDTTQDTTLEINLADFDNRCIGLMTEKGRLKENFMPLMVVDSLVNYNTTPTPSIGGTITYIKWNQDKTNAVAVYEAYKPQIGAVTTKTYALSKSMLYYVTSDNALYQYKGNSFVKVIDGKNYMQKVEIRPEYGTNTYNIMPNKYNIIIADTETIDIALNDVNDNNDYIIELSAVEIVGEPETKTINWPSTLIFDDEENVPKTEDFSYYTYLYGLVKISNGKLCEYKKFGSPKVKCNITMADGTVNEVWGYGTTLYAQEVRRFITTETAPSVRNVELKDTVELVSKNAFGGWFLSYVMGELVIPDSVVTIELGAFAGFSSISSLVIGASVETIGNRAFYFSSSNMEYIICKPTTPPTLDSSVFNVDGTSEVFIYVPDESLTAYQNAPVWGDDYAEYLRPISDMPTQP